MAMRSKNPAAFTLVELLTVIAIIGILAAIIIPVVGSVRQSARETQNLSNLRQIGTLYATYAADNKGAYPTAYANATGVSWRGLLNAYILPGADPTAQATAMRQLTNSPTAAIPNATGQGAHYSANTYLTADPASSASLAADGKGVLPVKAQWVIRPSQVILVADGTQSEAGGDAAPAFSKPDNWGTWTNVTKPYVYDAAKDTDTTAARGCLRFRNRGKLHAVHVDGSAKAYGQTDLTYGNIIPNS